MSQIEPTAIPDVKILTPKRFGDHRGFFSETYREDWDILPEGVRFVQDNHAFSAVPNTIRGLHFQFGPSTQAKLLRCVAGSILDVAVDIRKGSPTYGDWVAVELSAENGKQLLVPHGFAHAYQTILPDSHVLYKVDSLYDPKREGALLWSDPDIGVTWAEVDGEPQLSDKDRVAQSLRDFDTPFVYDETAPFHCHCIDR